MKRFVRLLDVLFIIALAFGVLFFPGLRRAEAQVSPPPPPEVDQALRDALRDAVAANQPHILGFLINDVEINEIFYSADRRTALLWLQQRDPDTGEVIGREPGLAIATNPNGLTSKSTDWTVSIQSTRSFIEALPNLPSELVTPDLLERYSTDATATEPKAVQTFTGYKLPWSNALNIKITGSIGHFLDYGSCAEISCRYAYDFWNPDATNRMFPLLASKGGVVWAYKETCNNGDTQCTNYLVLKDDSTTPTTYQLYYHLAHSSVPDNFVSKVTYVPQGGYIGNVDDTGASTDHHLHFMVYTTPTNTAYSWGYSVRILFSDTPYNGGEPRTCAETINYPSYGTECSMGKDGKKGGIDDDYLASGNVGSNPPQGSLNAPAPDTVVTSGSLTVSGSATDNLGITKVQILGNYDGTWRVLGEAGASGGVYSKTLDLCALAVPDGPISLAARIFDVEGNWAARYTGLRQIYKNYNCSSGGTPPPPPACTPAAGQIGVYSDVNFAGSCLRLNTGKVTAATLGGLNNKIASIQVSSGTCATLFDRDNSDPLGRAETFSAGDYNLADNRIGATLTSSITVEACTAPVDEPFLTFPGNLVDTDGNSRTAPNPAGPTSADSLVLAWTGGEGSKGFTSSLILGGQTVKSMAQANTNTWPVGTLAPGNYTWRVTAMGDGSSNSTDLAFTVSAGSLPAAATVTAPQTFDMESGAPGWTGTGLWKLTGLDKPLRGPTQAWVFSNGTSFNDATYRAGDLTSPPISIPPSGAYYLRFRFYSDVEGAPFLTQRIATPNWDQRRVQVSTDNGVTFSDLYQLEGDTQGIIWLDSPAINLSAYAGKTIRLRFHFDAVDGLDNTGLGWAVDDVRVDATAPENCADSNNSTATAQALTINGAAASGTICPGGDTDYYSFTGSAGTPVRINLDAKVLNAADPLDSFIALLDANGRDVLVLNDDEDPNNTADPFRDSLINTVLPRTGTYYVRVRAWDHPGAGGSAYTYKLAVTQIVAARPESVALSQPRDPKKLPVVPFIVETAVKDSPSGGGIRQVDFYWHSADWENDSWVKFGSDTTSADGWWAIFDPSFNGSKDPTKSTAGSSFYILATNTGGGSNGLLIQGMQPDLTAPASALNPLTKVINSTAVLLTWTAQDLQNDIDHFEFKYRVNGGAWTLWDQKPGSGLRSAWFIGAPGNYEFQMQAVDQASNQEGFPGVAEASAALNGTCTDDGNDQARTSALTQPLNTSAVHPLCQNDVDWVRFNAAKDQPVFIFLASRSGGASMRARLTDESGATQYLDLSSRGPGIGLQTTFIAPADGIYYLEITPADARIYGQDVLYLVYLGDPHQLHMPVISR